jgi:hypothetical protein
MQFFNERRSDTINSMSSLLSGKMWKEIEMGNEMETVDKWQKIGWGGGG